MQTICQWWREIGAARYFDALRLKITADGSGSNGLRVRLWKRELQCVVNVLGLEVTIDPFRHTIYA